MSIEDFAIYGLEPGQRALLWDFDQNKYVSVSKPTTSGGLLARVLPMAASLAAVHGFLAISFLGGFRS